MNKKDWENIEWKWHSGIIKPGYQIASGNNKDTPYPDGSIKLQKPHFAKLGLSLKGYYNGTINIHFPGYKWILQNPRICFPHLKWNNTTKPETFCFWPIVIRKDFTVINGLIYYPHPGTKTTHFQDECCVEILAPFIENIEYNTEIELGVNNDTCKLIKLQK